LIKTARHYLQQVNNEYRAKFQQQTGYFNGNCCVYSHILKDFKLQQINAILTKFTLTTFPVYFLICLFLTPIASA